MPVKVSSSATSESPAAEGEPGPAATPPFLLVLAETPDTGDSGDTREAVSWSWAACWLATSSSSILLQPSMSMSLVVVVVVTCGDTPARTSSSRT